MSNKPLIRDRDIVIVGQQPWDTAIGSNCKNLAVEFSKHNRVLYINSPLDRFSLIRNRKDPKIQKRLAVVRGKEKGLVRIQHHLWNLYPSHISASVSWIKNEFLFDSFNRLNNKRIAHDILASIGELGFQDVILFNDNDIYRSFYLKEFVQPKVSIYYSRDFMLAVDYWARHGKRLEPQLIAKSDLCVANSSYLADYCRRYNPASFYVGQGCDLEAFSIGNWPLPSDMNGLTSRPVIGYVGALQSLRLDAEIFAHIARERPDFNLILVGPEDDAFKASALHIMPNVHFLGSKHPDELPAYINAFDVCINPQILNQVTIGNYPRKIDEYLAVGKPVVATATKAMEIFADFTYLAAHKDDYVHLIDLAIAEDSAARQAARKTFAAGHTWENNAAEIYKAIRSLNHTTVGC